MTNIINTLKELSKKSNISLYAAICKAGYNPHNIYNKFSRGNIYFSDVEKLLASIGYHLEIKPNKQ
jgi:hypothetical protein